MEKDKIKDPGLDKIIPKDPGYPTDEKNDEIKKIIKEVEEAENDENN